MFTKLHLIVAATFIAALPIVQPAQAAPAQAAKGEKIIQAKKLTRAGQTFYCYKQQVTGTRLVRRTCVTQKELDFAGARVVTVGDEVQLVTATQGKSAGSN